MREALFEKRSEAGGVPRRTGILGGSFNPVHNAHIAMARAAAAEFALGRVLFIPLGQPPHKPAFEMAEASARLDMLHIAAAGVPGAEISEIETKRQGTTYTVDTLIELTAACPGESFYYIIGADTLFELETWREPARIAGMCSFIAFPRPGADIPGMRVKAEELEEKLGAAVYLSETVMPDVSSTLIRRCVTLGMPLTGLVPPGVEEYIIRNGLYR